MQRPTQPGPVSCPSAQPHMEGVQVLGVVAERDGAQRIAYLNAYLPATEDVLESASPLPPTAVFRLAARCEERKCRHFDGQACQLAARIVSMLPTVTEALPACVLRKSCRWYLQEGKAACLRCPQIATRIAAPDEQMKRVAGSAAAEADRSAEAVRASGRDPALRGANDAI